MASRPYIVGNWKMNGTRAMLSQARSIDRAAQKLMKVEVALAPPFTLIHAAHHEAKQIWIGAQDCHPDAEGAHTGDISAAMLADAGVQFVILGHSERRVDHLESSALVKQKSVAALGAGLRVILCCGENEDIRNAGQADSFVIEQISASLPDKIKAPSDNLAIAYEPIWAIGTGRTASIADIDAMHGTIRDLLVERFGEKQGRAIRILYGGSVKPENAGEILSRKEVGGALVGGASLMAESFMGIAAAAMDTADIK